MFLLITKFIFHSVKNESTSHTFFELNYNYYLHFFFMNETNPYLKSLSANKLAKKLRDPIFISSKTYFILKNFQSKLMSKVKSLITFYQERKFGYIANISEQRKMKSLKPSFLVSFKFFT